MGCLLYYQIGHAQTTIVTESPIYENLGIDHFTFHLRFIDMELNEPIAVNLHIFDTLQAISRPFLSQQTRQGSIKLKIPIAHAYKVNIFTSTHQDTSFILHFAQEESYEVEKEIYLKPQKVNLQVSIRDIDTDETLNMGGILQNRSRNEQILLSPENALGKGLYQVQVRQEDEYELEVKNSKSGLFLSNHRITPQDNNDHELQVKVLSALKNNTKIPLQYVNYTSGGAALNKSMERELKRVAELIKHYPNIKIEIAAHTDSVGNERNNLQLSQERAQNVYSFLVENGVPADKLRIQAYGASQPLTSNATPEGRIQNRRFELIVKSFEQAIK